MAEPKKPQKSGCNSNRNVNDTATNTEEKQKNRDKYKSDVPLQSNQASARNTHSMTSPRAEGEWFELAEKAMKGTKPLTRDTSNNDKPQGLDYKLTPKLEDTYFEEGDQQMTQEEIDDAYSEYLKDQQ